jgi:hypothetical protein
MGWLDRVLSIFGLKATSERKSLVLLHKVNIFELEVCKPKGVLRERPFWRMEKLDFYHRLADDSILHTPAS